MVLNELTILNYKNIRDATLRFSDKINCFVGLNGQGKTNLLDAIYLLSFTKSAFNAIDSQNITHGESIAMVRGLYSADKESDSEPFTISCGLKRGVKKQFRQGQKDYKRLVDHIGLIPLVMVSPEDGMLIGEGSEERRRFMDVVISQYDKEYLEHIGRYNALLKQRNALLRHAMDAGQTTLPAADEQLLSVLDLQMADRAERIYHARTLFLEAFIPVFQSLYAEISNGQEQVSLRYVSQLQDRNLIEAFQRTRQRDLILGWTSQGVHKDDMEMLLGDYPLKQVGSQGQQKTYLLAMKLAQAIYLSVQSEEGVHAPNARTKPILLLDDIFDKLDAERVQRIVTLINKEPFGQIFITDTDRQHLTQILGDVEGHIFHVEKGTIV